VIHLGVPWVRWTACAVAILLGLTCSVPPAVADEPPPPTPAATAAPTPVRSAAEARLDALQPSEVAAATTQTPMVEPASSDDRSFFKTKKGAFALVLLAGGLGYMIYSFSNDRVSSPQR